MKRWAIDKKNGRWRVLDRGIWHDSFDTLKDAHTYATQCAVADELYSPGGLTCLFNMLKKESI
jgi:hypothetical protein